MRKNLQVADLGDLLDQPLNAVLATYLSSGEILLAAVWHEWRDGAFHVVIGADDIKHRNLKRNPQASLTVIEALPLKDGGINRGIEIRGPAQIDRNEVYDLTRRMALRYLGPERVESYMQGLNGTDLVHVRLEPGKLRVWDYADELSQLS